MIMKFSTISSYDDYLVLTNVNQYFGYVSCYDKFHLAVYTADFRLCVSVQKLIKLKTRFMNISYVTYHMEQNMKSLLKLKFWPEVDHNHK